MFFAPTSFSAAWLWLRTLPCHRWCVGVAPRGDPGARGPGGLLPADAPVPLPARRTVPPLRGGDGHHRPANSGGAGPGGVPLGEVRLRGDLPVSRRQDLRGGRPGPAGERQPLRPGALRRDAGVERAGERRPQAGLHEDPSCRTESAPVEPRGEDDAAVVHRGHHAHDEGEHPVERSEEPRRRQQRDHAVW